MSHGRFGRLRALTLLVAFGIGFMGQMVVTAAMAMSMQMPQDAVALTSSTIDASGCPGCLLRQDGPAVPATMAPGCVTLAFCSVPPAVLPPGPIVPRPGRASFQPIAVQRDTGITVRPDLRPPRSLHHS